MKIILLIVIVLSSFFTHPLVFAGKTASESKLKPLAEQGDAGAQCRLGFMYYFGTGVPRDYMEAVKWFRLAAEQGDVDAQGTLGEMYYFGQGVTQNYTEALKWCRLAAEQGDAWAQCNLGAMYYKGEGVAQDYIEAHKWFNIAGANGSKEAIGVRDEVAKRMTPEQIAEAQRLAKEWMETHTGASVDTITKEKHDIKGNTTKMKPKNK